MQNKTFGPLKSVIQIWYGRYFNFTRLLLVPEKLSFRAVKYPYRTLM
jgi:hypothetical protein